MGKGSGGWVHIGTMDQVSCTYFATHSGLSPGPKSFLLQDCAKRRVHVTMRCIWPLTSLELWIYSKERNNISRGRMKALNDRV